MKPESIVTVAEIVEAIKRNGFGKNDRFGIADTQNCVMDPRYGDRYHVPVPEDYINIFNQYVNMNDVHRDIMSEMFEFVVTKNAELRKFQSTPRERHFDVVMGAASWLAPVDIEYYLTYSYETRPTWVNTLNSLAKQSYGLKKNINKYGFKEWIAFVLSPETSLQIIADHIEYLSDDDQDTLSNLLATHKSIVVPFELHSLISK